MTVAASSRTQNLASESHAEILTAIRDRIARCGQCNVKTSFLRDVLKRHFGFSSAKSGRVVRPIVQRLVAAGMLEYFDISAKNDIIYRVVIWRWQL